METKIARSCKVAALFLFGLTLGSIGPQQAAQGAALSGGAPVAPVIFSGDYKLVSDAVGLCSDFLKINSFAANDGTLNFNVGGFFFPHVNGEAQFYQDYLGKSSSKAYTTADSKMIVKTVDLDLADNILSRSMTVVSLVEKSATGDRAPRLQLDSNTKVAQYHGGVMTSELHCTYRAITCDETPWGCLPPHAH